jgi:hypothetical protein
MVVKRVLLLRRIEVRFLGLRRGMMDAGSCLSSRGIEDEAEVVFDIFAVLNSVEYVKVFGCD